MPVSRELTRYIHMYRTLIDTLINIISNVEMPGTEEGRFSSIDSWANSIAGLRTSVTGLGGFLLLNLKLLKIGEEPTPEY